MGRVRRFVVPLALVGTSFVAGMFVGPPREARGEKRDETPHAVLEQLARVLVQIENRYVDPVERQRLLEGAIKGMVAELDPHSEYFPPKDYTEFNDETAGKFGGVGIEFDASGEFLRVVQPIEGGPAEEAGIKIGDEVVAVDGKDAKNIGLEKSLRIIRGEPGTKIELTIRRPSEGGKLYRVPLTRREIHVNSVDWDALPGGIGWIRIRAFQEKTHGELVDAIVKLKAKAGKLTGVVLDMRRDPGGLVDQAVEVADELLESGIIFSTRGQNGTIVEVTKATPGGALTDVPMVLLVDEGTASAAELVAGALQDNKRALVVGLTTFGKGIVQTLIELGGGAGMKLTTARYYSPSGRSIQWQGIVPDVPTDPARPIGYGIPFKERDYPNAIPPDGPIKASTGPKLPTLASASASASTSPSTSASGASSSTPPKPAFTLGHKPEYDKDFQLKAAFEVLAGVIAQKK